MYVILNTNYFHIPPDCWGVVIVVICEECTLLPHSYSNYTVLYQYILLDTYTYYAYYTHYILYCYICSFIIPPLKSLNARILLISRV